MLASHPLQAQSLDGLVEFVDRTDDLKDKRAFRDDGSRIGRDPSVLRERNDG